MKTNNYWLQFVISVLGTAIGVALTFGLNGRLESRKQAQAQRLTAIMVIHDIDNTIDELKRMKKLEEDRCKLLEYATDHKGHLDKVPYDTLKSIINNLLNNNSEYRFDNSKEKIFNSDLDTWQNLGNMKFIDNVQSFFYDRQLVQEELNQAEFWYRPIPQDEYMQLFMGVGWLTQESYCALAYPFLEKKLHDKRVKYFIDVADFRVDYLKQTIDAWTTQNDENKFLMGITDQELEDYVNSMDINGLAVTKRNLSGSWESTLNDEDYKSYTFNADRTFSSTNVIQSTSGRWQQWRGKFTLQVDYSGTWEMKEDSLFLKTDPQSYKFEVDDSGLIPEEGQQDSLKAWIANYREQGLKAYSELPEEKLLVSYKARLDSSKDKMEWTDPDGSVQYLKRKRDHSSSSFVNE